MPERGVVDGFDELALLLGISPDELTRLLPEPVWALPDDSEPAGAGPGVTWWLAAGDHVLVVVGVGFGVLVVGVPEFHWHSQIPVIYLVSSERLEVAGDGGDVAWFRAKVEAAIQSRRSIFERCGRCDGRVPPERMFDGEICQVCAQDDGVVF